ncbi:MAG: hypothetical protein U0638_12375 [Phycisphaerales bacterium]
MQPIVEVLRTDAILMEDVGLGVKEAALEEADLHLAPLEERDEVLDQAEGRRVERHPGQVP